MPDIAARVNAATRTWRVPINTLFLISVCIAFPTRADTPAVLDVEHAPIVVADLEKAQDDFRAIGFAIKPGRPHADGIRNAHVKFPDGTELELITAPAPKDELTAEYYAKARRGDGPIYYGLWAADTRTMEMRIKTIGAPVEREGYLLTFPSGHPLHHLFFGSGENSPTDRPEHFAHSNSAIRMSGYWVRGNSEEQALLTQLGVRFRRAKPCGPLGEVEVARLPRGEVLFTSQGPHDGTMIGARIEVTNLQLAKAVMEKGGLKPTSYSGCASLWLPPNRAHGIWLEFVPARK
ncbi:VOC family protein [Bradyrhizobium sp. USDA 4473]